MSLGRGAATASNLTDQEAYRVKQQMIGELHKNHAGQLWNTIDERFMDSQYLPAEWLSRWSRCTRYRDL